MRLSHSDPEVGFVAPTSALEGLAHDPRRNLSSSTLCPTDLGGGPPDPRIRVARSPRTVLLCREVREVKIALVGFQTVDGNMLEGPVCNKCYSEKSTNQIIRETANNFFYVARFHDNNLVTLYRVVF